MSVLSLLVKFLESDDAILPENSVLAVSIPESMRMIFTFELPVEYVQASSTYISAEADGVTVSEQPCP